MRVGVFIQARMNSSRFYGKSLVKLYNNLTLLETVINNARLIDADEIAVLIPKKDKKFFKPYIPKDIKLITGEEDDVLGRFITAIKKLNVHYIFRATADKPFISPKQTNELLKIAMAEPEYQFYGWHGMPYEDTTYGLYTADALMTLYNSRFLTPLIKEHIKPGIMEYFKYKILNSPNIRKKFIKLTIDTPNDLIDIQNFLLKRKGSTII